MSTVLDDLQLAGNTYLDDLDSLNLGYITGNGALSNPIPTVSGDGETERVSVDATLDAPVPVVVGVGERILWARGSPVPLFAPAATITGVGGLVRDGSGAVTGTLPTLTGTAERVLPGSGSAIGSVARAAGVGVILSAGIGTLDAPLPTVTGAGTKSEPRTGSGTPSVAAATIFGFGNTGDTIAGGGNQVNYPATFSGAGVILKSGSGTLDAGFPFVSAVGNVGVAQTNDGDTISAAASVDSAGYITRKTAPALQSAPAVTTGTVIVEGVTSGAGASAPNSAFLSCLGLVITAPVGPVDFPTDHIAIVTPNASQFYTTAITGQVSQLENFTTVGARMGDEVGVTVDLSGVISNPRYFLFELVSNDFRWEVGEALNVGRATDDLTKWYEFDQVTTLNDSAKAWSVVAASGTPGANALQIVDDIGGSETCISEEFIIGAGKTYQVSTWARQTSGDRANRLFVDFYDSGGARINVSTPSDATGWPIIAFGHYYQSATDGIVFPSSWTNYSITFGPDGTASIPSGAVTFRIGAYTTSEGTTSSTVEFQDMYVADLSAKGYGPLGGPVGIELTVLYNNELTRIASFTPAYESIYLLNYPSDRTRFYAVRDALTAGECTFYLGGYETVATRSYGLAFPDTGSLNVIIDQ